MIENEKNMEPEMNPYDNLIEPTAEPVRSPVILGNAGGTEPARKAETPMEIIPLAGASVYSKVTAKEWVRSSEIEMEVEEDLLVPDTFPDMESVLNMDGKIASINIYNDGGRSAVRGEICLETMYRSAEVYGSNISVIPATVDFRRQLKEEFPDADGKQTVCGRINKLEYRIINERKYKVKVFMRLTVREQQEKERLIFDGIEGEKLYLHREKACFLTLDSQKRKESEISEELLINDEKIRPVKILKTNVTIAENHRQLTKEKLVLNHSVWVRIMYMAEIAGKGELFNQPMLFQGKIDHTEFISAGKSEDEITACTVQSCVDDLTVEINNESTGFHVSGEVVTEADFYGAIEKDVVTDFYHDKEDMTCDSREELICAGLDSVAAECMLRESISLQQENSDELRIIYLDAHIIDAEARSEGTNVVASGKVQLEAVTMNEGDYSVVVKKFCDFTCTKELAGGAADRVEIGKVFVREMTGEITGSNAVNLTAQIQAQLNIYNEAGLKCISNPCFIRSGEPEKHYPIIVHTVKEGETLWDIGKRFKVSEEMVTAVNREENIRPGKKIVIVKN